MENNAIDVHVNAASQGAREVSFLLELGTHRNMGRIIDEIAQWSSDFLLYA